MKTLVKHFIEQTVYPDKDSQQWLAFLVLKEKYPNLTYLSYDGYHCHGLADYSVNFNWQGSRIVVWDNSYTWREHMETAKQLEKDFEEYSSTGIVNIWMDLLGETEESKKAWINGPHRELK